MTLNPEMESIIKHLEGTLKQSRTVEETLLFLEDLDTAIADWRIEQISSLDRFDAKASPREIAEKITAGEIPNQYIGEKNQMVLRQEIFSLLNTKRLFRESSFENELFARIEELKRIAPDSYLSILDEIRIKFSDIERAVDAWQSRKGIRLEEKTPEPNREGAEI